MQGLLMLKRILIRKKLKGIFVRENLKISIIIKNVIEAEDTMIHSAERPSNYFFQHFHT